MRGCVRVLAVGALWLAACRSSAGPSHVIAPDLGVRSDAGCAFRWTSPDGKRAVGCLRNGIRYLVTEPFGESRRPRLTWTVGELHEAPLFGLAIWATLAKLSQVQTKLGLGSELDETSFGLPESPIEAGNLVANWIQARAADADIHALRPTLKDELEGRQTYIPPESSKPRLYPYDVDWPGTRPMRDGLPTPVLLAEFEQTYLRADQLLISFESNQPASQVIAELERTAGAVSFAPSMPAPEPALANELRVYAGFWSSKLHWMLPDPKVSPSESLHELAVRSLFRRALANRWSMAQVAWGELSEVDAVSDPFGQHTRRTVLLVGAAGQSELTRWRDALVEAERLRRFGFTAHELEHARDTKRHRYVMEFSDHRHPWSPESCDITERVLRGLQPITCYEERHALVAEWANVDLSELNQRAGRLRLDQAALEVSSRDDAPLAPQPTLQQLRALVAEVQGSALRPWGMVDPLPMPTPNGKIVRTTRADDIVTLELSNGATVRWHRTADPVLRLHATSPGGIHALPVADHACADDALLGIVAAGLGAFDTVRVHRHMAEQWVTLVPTLEFQHEGFIGSAPSDQIDALLSWLYLAMTAMHAPAPGSYSDQAFSFELEDRRCASPQTRMLVRDRFRNAADFTIELWGSLDEAALHDSVSRWLAPIPGDPTMRERLVAAPPAGLRRHAFWSAPLPAWYSDLQPAD